MLQNQIVFSDFAESHGEQVENGKDKEYQDWIGEMSVPGGRIPSCGCNPKHALRKTGIDDARDNERSDSDSKALEISNLLLSILNSAHQHRIVKDDCAIANLADLTVLLAHFLIHVDKPESRWHVRYQPDELPGYSQRRYKNREEHAGDDRTHTDETGC